MDAAGNPLLDEQNPWPGLAAYDETDARFFNGRIAEVDELFRLIGLSPLVAFYGKSGLGKTSLLQAGLMPKLRAAHFLPVLIRIDYSATAGSAMEQIALCLFAELAGVGAEYASRASGESLWCYLHRRDLEFWSGDNHPLVPVFVLDQFEELYSQGGRDPKRQAVIKLELASLFENLEPPELAPITERSSRSGLNTTAHRYRTLISFREDYLPEFKQWARDLPALLKRELRLLPMSRRTAVEAVEKSGQAILLPDTADAIVDFIGNISQSQGETDKTIEPVLLSLCCYRLNLKRPLEGGIRKPIDSVLLHDFGEGILEEFYHEALAGMPDSVAMFIEDDLIQGNRYRGSFPRDEAIAQGKISEGQLRELTDKHRLLRIVQQADTARIELVHDRLVGLASKSRDQRLALARQEEERRGLTEARRIVEGRRLKASVVALIGFLLLLTLVSAYAFYKRDVANSNALRANALLLSLKGQSIISGERPDIPKNIEKGLLTVLAAHRLSSSHDVKAKNESFDALQWEHRLLLRLLFLRDAGNRIAAVAFSPDSQRIISGSGDNSLRLWDAVSGNLLREIKDKHQGGISSLAFSPDGLQIVSGSGDKRMRLWDAASGKLLREFKDGHTDGVSSVAFSPDGRWLVSGSWDKTLRIWDATSGMTIGQPLMGHSKGVTSLAVSPDGRRIVSGSEDKSLRLWDLATGKPLGEALIGHDEVVTSVAFSPDRRLIVSGSGDTTMRLWDAVTGVSLGEIRNGHTEGITSVVFSPDSQWIVSGSWDKTVRLWNVASREPRGNLMYGQTGGVVSLAFSSKGWRIVTGGWGKTLCLLNASIDKLWGEPLTGHTKGVNSLAFSPDGKRIISGSGDKTLRLWDAATGKTLGVAAGHAERISSVAFSPDGRLLVSGSGDKTLRLWKAATGKSMGEPLVGHAGAVSSVAFSPDGPRIVSGSEDKTLRLWDAATGKSVGEPLVGHAGAVSSVAFSPDGRRIVSGSRDKTLRLWDAATGKSVGEPLVGHDGAVSSVAFNPNGQLIASGSEDKTLRLWDAATGQAVGEPLQRHFARVTSVAFSPDGQLIASGSGDKTLRFWDAATGKSVGEPLIGHEGSVSSVTFSPDGQLIASGGWDTTLLLQPVEHEDWAKALCKKLSHNMSLIEWQDMVSSDIPYVCQCPELPIRPDNHELSAEPKRCPPR